MVKDLFESSHKPNESAGTKNFLLVRDIKMFTETHPLDHSKPVNSSHLLHSVILSLMSMLFSPLRLDFSGRLPPSFSGQNFIYSFDLHDTFPSLAYCLTNYRIIRRLQLMPVNVLLKLMLSMPSEN